MLALYSIGGVLLALLLLALAPVRADVAFREGFSLTVRYLFLRFPLLPGKEEEEAPPQPEEEKAGPSPMDRLKAILRRAGFWGFLQALADFIQVLLKASGRLLSHVKLKRFDLYLCLGGAEDAAAAAVRYGQVGSGVYGACGLLFSLLPCKEKGVSVDLDYSTLENTVDFSACFSLRPLFAVTAGVRVLLGALPVLRLLRKAGPGEGGGSRKSTAPGNGAGTKKRAENAGLGHSRASGGN